jgi:hypothetical protein
MPRAVQLVHVSRTRRVEARRAELAGEGVQRISGGVQCTVIWVEGHDHIQHLAAALLLRRRQRAYAHLPESGGRGAVCECVCVCACERVRVQASRHILVSTDQPA